MAFSDVRFLHYQWTALQAAWNETWREWSPLSPKQFLFTLLGLAASWYVAIRLGIQDEYTTPFGIITIVVPIVLWCAFFIFERIKAPIRLIDGLERQIVTFSNELDRIKMPRLLLEFRPNDSRYVVDFGSGQKATYIRLFNDSGEDVSRIEVFTNGIIPTGSGAGRILVRTPPRLSQKPIHLCPGDECFVKILTLNSSIEGDEITTLHHSGAVTLTTVGPQFRMKVVVVGRGLYPAIRREFRFGVIDEHISVSEID